MTFEESILIGATPADLFSLSQDYAKRLQWDPFLKTAQLVGNVNEIRIGVRAWCVAKSGLGMETEYISFRPPRVTAVKMTQGPWFIDCFAGTWRFEDAAPGQTRLRFRYHLRAWPRWLSWLLTPMFGVVFGHDTRKRLRALKIAGELPRECQISRGPSGRG